MTPYEELSEVLEEDITRYTDTAVICDNGEERSDVLQVLKNMGFILDSYSDNVISDTFNNDYPYPYIRKPNSVMCCRPGHSAVRHGITYENFMEATSGEKNAASYRMTDEEFSAALDALLA